MWSEARLEIWQSGSRVRAFHPPGYTAAPLSSPPLTLGGGPSWFLFLWSQTGRMASARGPLTCAADFQMASPGAPLPAPLTHLLPALRSVWLSSRCNSIRVISLSTPPHATPHLTTHTPFLHNRSFPLFFERNDLTQRNSKDVCVQF